MSLIKRRNNYFSIPDILASQERVPCTFVKNVTHLESLDPSSNSGVLIEGSALELPLWMAQSLEQANASNIEIPSVYKPVYRDILKAEANVVDLYQLSKFFYEFGKMVAATLRRGARDLLETLTQTFRDRAGDILERAQVTTEPYAIDKLDSLERELVSRGKAANTMLDQWLASSSSAIRIASLVNYHKKRRLIENAFS